MFHSSCVEPLKAAINTGDARSGDSENLEGKADQHSTDNITGKLLATASAEAFTSKA